MFDIGPSESESMLPGCDRVFLFDAGIGNSSSSTSLESVDLLEVLETSTIEILRVPPKSPLFALLLDRLGVDAFPGEEEDCVGRSDV